MASVDVSGLIRLLVWITVVAAVVGLFLAFAPTISLDVEDIESSNFYHYVKVACYFFPVTDCAVIIGLVISFWCLRIALILGKHVMEFFGA